MRLKDSSRFSLRSFFRLSRIFLSVSVGFSGWVSYLKYTGQISSESVFIFAGIFLLTSGASALNQYQERSFDLLMNRTRQRPLPAGQISKFPALLISVILIVSGLIVLSYYGNIESFAAGLFSVLWYNLFYTLLKRKTPYAIFPAVLTGAGPVIIGWLAAGGQGADNTCLIISAFMCLWQIPHFLLLLMHYRDDYKKAGFPLLTEHFSIRTVKNMISGTMIMIAFVIIFFIKYGIINSLSLQVVSMVLTGFILFYVILSMGKKKLNCRLPMIMLNSYMLLIMLLIMADSLLTAI
jgi:heme o synthase